MRAPHLADLDAATVDLERGHGPHAARRRGLLVGVHVDLVRVRVSANPNPNPGIDLDLEPKPNPNTLTLILALTLTNVHHGNSAASVSK